MHIAATSAIVISHLWVIVVPRRELQLRNTLYYYQIYPNIHNTFGNRSAVSARDNSSSVHIAAMSAIVISHLWVIATLRHELQSRHTFVITIKFIKYTVHCLRYSTIIGIAHCLYFIDGHYLSRLQARESLLGATRWHKIN